MIYRSNLTCLDLTPHFKHIVSRPMPHSFGHDVPSDWADKADDDPVFGIYKRCGMFTHDEAAILFSVAVRCGGEWLDIGAHTGWTSAHIAAAGSSVDAIDPMLCRVNFQDRFLANTQHFWTWLDECHDKASDEFFALPPRGKFRGFCVDGCHEDGQPQRDALNAAKHLAQTGVIIFHDGVGRPVREAAQLLMAQGFKCRAYFTPYLLLCCWRGDFSPPDHEPDSAVKAAHLDGRYPDFDFGACV